MNSNSLSEFTQNIYKKLPESSEWQWLLKNHPKLTYAGYGAFGETTICGLDTAEKWQTQRDVFINATDDILLEVAKAKAYLRMATQTKQANKNHTSYGLKHAAERYLRRNDKSEKLNHYVSNGSFIAAAILEGFTIYGLGNVYINISERSIKTLENYS